MDDFRNFVIDAKPDENNGRASHDQITVCPIEGSGVIAGFYHYGMVPREIFTNWCDYDISRPILDLGNIYSPFINSTNKQLFRGYGPETLIFCGYKVKRQRSYGQEVSGLIRFRFRWRLIPWNLILNGDGSFVRADSEFSYNSMYWSNLFPDDVSIHLSHHKED